ncbi:acyl-CoA dehydrogenase family protein [uncultured Bradyrhizobium sp.]|uniref:acyl-CoA dehydrogenase family protein n=1 Tax=uncultured Bradyrhizobium sp. TaxID=199684 RepID=UPI0035CB5F86
MNYTGPGLANEASTPHRCLDADYLALPFFDDRHREVAARLESWLREKDAAIEAALAQSPKEATRRAIGLLGEAGWFSAAVSESIDYRIICIVREGLAYRHDLLDFAFSIQVLSALPLVLWGTEDQRSQFLPGLLAGRRIAAFALTERESGSDVASVALAATPAGQDYRLAGEKNWIANADIADHIMVLARTGAGTGPMGLSLFFADASTAGLTAEAVELIAPRPFGHLHFADCVIPGGRIIGGNGAGLAVALDTLERVRMSVGAAANGFARRALHEARTHVTRVRATGTRLADIPVVQQKLARMAVALHTARLAVAQAAWDMDRDGGSRCLTSSLAKLHATETAQSVVDDCVQLHGAAGVVSNSVPERLYRQVRSLRIYEGTSEIQEAILGEAVTYGFLG